MPSALSIIGFAAVLMAGAGGAYEWDRHPPIGWHAHVLWWSPGFSLPSSLLEQRDQALARAQARTADLGRCTSALQAQGAAVTAAGQRSAADLRASSAALAATRDQVASLRRQSVAARAYVPAGVDACARWEDADRLVLLMLRGG